MAFGNPAISSTPVDSDLLRSQADLYGNNFSNPMNPANMNSGWGIDPSLLTPSYTAPFRPQYAGPQPYNDYGRPGFAQSTAYLLGLGQDPRWGNPFQHQQPYIQSATYRPADATMWGMQRIAAPAALMAGAGMMMGGFNSFGMARGAYSFGSKLGFGLGSGLATGMGAAEGGFLANAAGRSLGMAAGMAAGYLLPLGAMQAGMWGLDKTIFSPYANSRRSAEDYRNNFSGITFGSNYGNSVTGGGIGGRTSAMLGNDITQLGIGDMTFSTGEYGAGASMIARSGLMDNIQIGGMTKRVKESMEQVKLIMSIASMPEMKDAIEQLAKLQQMGASVQGGLSSTAASTMNQIGRYASIAGTTVQRMMNTVGAQGQYLYQANGMTPYLGQLAAANIYSSMSAGNRMGLISEAQLARMGGLDGATQSAMTGQINASQTLYNKIANFNQYLGGGRSNSMIGNLNQFGQRMANNPMGTYGAMMLYGGQMAGRQLEERGSLAVEDQLMQIAQNVPGLLDSNGKLSFEKAVPYLMQMGMSMDEIQAYGAQRISETDPASYQMKLAGIDRTNTEQERQYISQRGIYSGMFMGPYYSMRKAGRKLTQAISRNIVSPITEMLGSAEDTMQYGVDQMWFGGTIDDLLSSGGSTEGLQYLKGGKGKAGDLAEKINKLARKGHPDAIAYLRADDAASKKSALDKLLKGKALGDESKDYLENYNSYQDVSKMLSGMDRAADPTESRTRNNPQVMIGKLRRDITVDAIETNTQDAVKKTSSELVKGAGLSKGDEFDAVNAYGLAYRIANKYKSGNIDATNLDEAMKSDPDLIRYSKLTGLTGQALLDQAVKTGVMGVKKGIVGYAEASLGVDRSKYSDVKGALNEAAQRNGGKVFNNGLQNAEDLDADEALGFGISDQESAKIKSQMFEKMKSGRLDFSGYQSTMNALENKKTIDTFDKAVKKFSDTVNGMDSNKKNPNFSWNFFSGAPQAGTEKGQAILNYMQGNR